MPICRIVTALTVRLSGSDLVLQQCGWTVVESKMLDPQGVLFQEEPLCAISAEAALLQNLESEGGLHNYKQLYVFSSEHYLSSKGYRWIVAAL